MAVAAPDHLAVKAILRLLAFALPTSISLPDPRGYCVSPSAARAAPRPRVRTAMRAIEVVWRMRIGLPGCVGYRNSGLLANLNSLSWRLPAPYGSAGVLKGAGGCLTGSRPGGRAGSGCARPHPDRPRP